MESAKPREWEKKIEYLLWSYRSLPHSTLGCSPYQMVYGRLPRGPLSVLRDQLYGRADGPALSTSTVKEFCEKIASDIKVGYDLAAVESAKAQDHYVSHYNKRSKDKSFDVGKQVIVLFPDSNNKMLAKFQGPAMIKEKLNDYAYLVEMPNGAVRRLHANKLCKYVCRAVGVVLHADEQDFGDLPEYPSSVSVPPVGDIFDAVDLSHLDPAQQQQLLAVLRRHVSVFSDAPGRCTVGEHVIQLVDGAVHRRRAPYHIPESVRA